MRSSSLNFERDIYSISRLNSEVRAVLEGSFPLLWVEGEISNLASPASGHLYFSLKDAHAQVRCALFRMVRNRLRFRPANGMQVLARVRVSLYEGRGEFQLVVEHVEPAGEGALRQAFEQLKNKLAAEGLFDSGRKRELPSYPHSIGVVTSPSGAAIRDVLSVLQRRFPALPVVLYPTLVQGADAPEGIVRALRLAECRQECDVLLLVRGGGSLEDLMAFNDEAVARAVAACAIPVVCGVGHEMDFSIADFVADRRAATPSAAAELASPDRQQVLRTLTQSLHRMRQAQLVHLRGHKGRLLTQWHRLNTLHPERRLGQWQQRMDELELRLRSALIGRIGHAKGCIATLSARLQGATPVHRITRRRQRLDDGRRRLQHAVQRSLERGDERLRRVGATLDAVSPLATLSRGYAVVCTHPGTRVLHRADEVEVGERVRARLGRGGLVCRVERILADE